MARDLTHYIHARAAEARNLAAVHKSLCLLANDAIDNGMPELARCYHRSVVRIDGEVHQADVDVQCAVARLGAQPKLPPPSPAQ